MTAKPQYFMSTWNEFEKFIKTTSDYCEIIQKVNGKYHCWSFPRAYVTSSDEDLTPITAQQYNRTKYSMEANTNDK